MSTSPELIDIQDTVHGEAIPSTETRNLNHLFEGDEANDSTDNECLFTAVHEHLVEILHHVKELKEVSGKTKEGDAVTREEFDAA